MDPQPFVRLSVGQLGLKLPGGNASKASSRLCDCEIRLGGFPVQTAQVPLIHSPEFNLDPFTNAAVFSLDESDLRSLAAPGCFRPPRPCLEVAVYLARFGGARCGVTWRKRLVGVFRVELASSSEWRDGKPVLLHHGWAGIGKGAAEARPELHLRVKMEADPRYIFQFDDEVALNPQVVQLHGSSRQPIFSCKFIRDRRRPSQGDGQYWSSSGGSEETDMEMAMRRERKGWKVVIHDLSGSAVAAAFMATPFVPAPGGDTVARSNPGAWLIVRAGTTGSSDSWQPWGRLEAWRESSSSAPAASSRDTVRLRLHLLPDGQDDCVLVSEAPLGSDKGGEFSIDMDRQAPAPVPAAEGGTRPAAAQGGGGPLPVAVPVPVPGVAVRLLLPPRARRVPLLLLRQGPRGPAGAPAAVHPDAAVRAAAVPLQPALRLPGLLRGRPLLRLHHHVNAITPSRASVLISMPLITYHSTTSAYCHPNHASCTINPSPYRFIILRILY